MSKEASIEIDITSEENKLVLEVWLRKRNGGLYTLQKNRNKVRFNSVQRLINLLETYKKENFLTPEPCLFCGGKVTILQLHYGAYKIVCPECDFVSRVYESDYEAVSSYNKIAKGEK